MAQIKIEEIWIAEFQATPEYNFEGDDGKLIKIDAVEAHTAACVRGTIQDGTQRTLEFELPEGYDHKKAKIGSILHVVCKRLAGLDAPLKIKHVTRTLEGGK